MNINSLTNPSRSVWKSMTSWVADLLPGDSYQPDSPQKKWTVMLWSASDTNLYPYMQADLDRAEAVGSTAQMNLIAQTDHAPEGGGARRYELHKDAAAGLHSPIRAELGDTNMADPAQLSDFIQWTIKNYPAENYMLVMGGHGDGPYGLCRDDSHDSWMGLDGLQANLQEAREKTGQKLDVLAFDACLMGNAEVLDQLKGEASFLVASEEIADAAGWDYAQALTSGDLSPQEMARNIVTMAGDRNNIYPTMAAYDAAKIQAVTHAVQDFRQAIQDSSLSSADLQAARRDTQRFRQFNDLSHFASQVESRAGSDDTLREAAQAVQSAVSDSIVAQEHSSSYPNARGLSIELDQRPNEKYDSFSFAQATHWNDVQARLGEKTTTGLQALLNAGLD